MVRKAGLAERLALRVTRWSGSSAAFLIAILVVFIWLVTGPIFDYSNTWQLVINTGTTIVTFLMVFLIQRSQNKESQALQLKLNELIAAVQGASNRLINVEDLTEAEVGTLHHHYGRLATLAQQEEQLTVSHSIEEAAGRQQNKKHGTQGGTPGKQSGADCAARKRHPSRQDSADSTPTA